MADEDLSSSETYLKKSNRTILFVGLGALLAFLGGVFVLMGGGDSFKEDAKITIGDSNLNSDVSGTGADALGMNFPKDGAGENAAPQDKGVRVIASPDSVKFEQVVIGTEAEATVTLSGSSGKVSIIEVNFEEVQKDGFTLENKCKANEMLTGDASCNVIIRWEPKQARSIQNNLAVRWRDESFGIIGKKVVIPVSATAIDTSMCGVCDNVGSSGGTMVDNLKQKGRVVLGPDGKPIGYADENGNVYGFDGKKVGTLQSDGTVVDSDGYVIGVAEAQKVALGPNGEPVGTVLPDGRVVDANGKVIGRMLADGTIIDDNGNVVGSAAKMGNVFDKFGTIIGKVLPDGRVVNAKNDLIGYLNPDSTVVGVDGQMIGSLVPQGGVVNSKGTSVGVVLPDGRVVDANGALVGRVLPNGMVIDGNNAVAGRVVQPGIAVGGSCKILGLVSTDGSVVNANKVVGKMTSGRMIVDLGGNPIGRYVAEGPLFDWDGKIVGKIDSDGTPVNLKGELMGCLTPEATVLNDDMEIIARVLPKGAVVGPKCEMRGYVMPDASVVQNGEMTGRLLPDGTFMGKDGKIGGALAPFGVALKSACQVAGYPTVIDAQIVAAGGQEVLGCLASDGNVLDMTTKAVKAHIPATPVVIASDGFVAGQMNLKGQLLNKQGQVVGCVDPAGVAVDSKNDVLGALMPQGSVLSPKGKTVAYVAPSGTAADMKGAVLGRVFSDGTVVSAGGQVVARTVPQGIPVQNACTVLGRVLSDGRVVDAAMNRKGFIQFDNSVLDAKGAFVGRVIDAKGALNGADAFIGTVTDDASVVDAQGAKIGCLRPDSLIGKAGAENTFLGTPLAEGLAVDSEGKLAARGNAVGVAQNLEATKDVGKVAATGYIKNKDNVIFSGIIPGGVPVFDASGKKNGRLLPDGTAVTLKSEFMGQLQLPDGRVVDAKGSTVGHIYMGLRQVVDKNGNIIGVAQPDGTVVNAQGIVSGYMTPSGRVYDASGKEIGEMLPNGDVVLDVNGNVLGYVSPTGEIVGADGNVVGKYASNKRVLNADGQVIGYKVAEGVALDFDNVSLGKINASGNVVNADKKTVGRFLPDENIVNDDNAVIGSGVIDGIAVGPSCALLGNIQAETATVVGPTGENVGRLTYDKGILDASNALIGLALGPKAVVNDKCEIVGRLDLSGRVLNNAHEDLGCVGFDGIVRDKKGTEKGRMVQKGDVVSFDGSHIGHVVGDGDLLDYNGAPLGCFTRDGVVIDKDGNIIGASTGWKYLTDTHGRLVGRVIGGKYVVDAENGFAVGDVDAEGVARYKSGKEIGTEIPVGRLVISRDGTPVGTVTPEGRILDAQRKDVGFVTADMRALANDKKFLGRVVPVGAQCLANGQTVGTVNYAGGIVNDAKEEIGVLQASGKGVSKDGNDLCWVSLTNVQDGFIRSAFADQEVRNANGDVAGTVSAEGYIRDSNGKIAGRALFDGSTVDSNGAALEALTSPRSIAELKDAAARKVYAPGEREVGVLGTDGWVRGADDKIVGRAFENGLVTNDKGELIGFVGPVERYIGRQILNSDGKAFGKVGSDGMVKDDVGNTFGRLLENGSVIDWNGKIVGQVSSISGKETSKIAVGRDGQFLGVVGADGLLRDNEGNVIGRVAEDGTIVDVNGNPIGSVMEGEPLRDADGNLIGVISQQGDVMNLNGQVIGRVNADGKIVDEKGNVVGNWQKDGTFLSENAAFRPKYAYSKTGKRLGIVLDDGSVIDENGNIIGVVDEGGNVLNANGETIASLKTLEEQQKETAKNKPVVTEKEDETIPVGGGTSIGSAYGRAYGARGGGTGRGERYNMQRLAFLRQKQEERRRSSRLGEMRGATQQDIDKQRLRKRKISKDWSDLGVEKSVSSYRVDMSRMLLADKAIPAVLVRSLDSRYPNVPVSAIVERNIFSESGRNIIIPAGSRLIGKMASSAGGSGMAPSVKVTIQWTRLVRPDGAAFMFEEGTSGDAQGRGGIPGYLDLQLLRRFGLPLLETVVESAALWAMADGSVPSVTNSGTVVLSAKQQAVEDARQNFSDKMQDVFDSIFDQLKETQAVTFIPSGTRITVFANRDLWLRSDEEDEADDLEAAGGQQNAQAAQNNAQQSSGGPSSSGASAGAAAQQTQAAQQQQTQPQAGSPSSMPQGGYYGYGQNVAVPPQQGNVSAAAPQQPMPASAPPVATSDADDGVPELF